MLRAFRMVCLSYFIFCGGFSFPAAAEDVNLEEALAAYEAACEAVPAFEVYLTAFSQAGQGGTGAYLRTTKHLYQGGKYRVDQLQDRAGEFRIGDNTTTWNGVEERSFNIGSRTGKLDSRSTTLPTAQGPAYLNFFMLFNGSELTYTDFLRREESATASRDPDGELVLDAPPNPKVRRALNSFGIKLTLDPQCGLMPRSIELSLATAAHEGRVAYTTLNNDLKEVSPGCWLPVATTMDIYEFDASNSNFGQVVAQHTFQVDLEKSRFNIQADDSLFTLEFPAGAVVNDKIRHSIYRVGAESRQQFLDELAARGRLGRDALRAADPGAKSIAYYNGNRAMFISLNVVAVITLAILVGIRRMRARRHVS